MRCSLQFRAINAGAIDDCAADARVAVVPVRHALTAAEGATLASEDERLLDARARTHGGYPTSPASAGATATVTAEQAGARTRARRDW
jgi:hypothetical protein